MLESLCRAECLSWTKNMDLGSQHLKLVPIVLCWRYSWNFISWAQKETVKIFVLIHKEVENSCNPCLSEFLIKITKTSMYFSQYFGYWIICRKPQKMLVPYSNQGDSQVFFFLFFSLLQLYLCFPSDVDKCLLLMGKTSHETWERTQEQCRQLSRLVFLRVCKSLPILM